MTQQHPTARAPWTRTAARVIPFVLVAGGLAAAGSPSYAAEPAGAAPAVTPGDAPLTLTPQPVLEGPGTPGTMLQVITGTWDDGVELSIQWLIDGKPSPGAVGPTWDVTLADSATTLSVAVTGSKEGYTPVTRVSEGVRVPGQTQTSTPVPVVSGTARFGLTLIATAGAWDQGVSLGYQWRRNGAAIAGATESFYRLGLADLGTRLTVAVTGSEPGFDPVTRISAPSAVVVRATLGAGRVTVTGRPRVGRTLKARPIGFADGVHVTYAWFAGAKRIGTKPALRLGRATVGKRITVRVSVTKTGYVGRTAVSRPTARVVRK